MARSAKRGYVFSPTEAFVPTPMTGLWMRTHACVVYVACPQCSADVGKLCMSNDGLFVAYTHRSRREAWARLPQNQFWPQMVRL